MNTDRQDSNDWMDIFQILNANDPDGMRQILEIVYNSVMRIERDHAIGAGPYERTSGRKDYANGFKPKKFKTRMGVLNLEIP